MWPDRFSDAQLRIIARDFVAPRNDWLDLLRDRTTISVIASAAKQSRLPRRNDSGLLRYAAALAMTMRKHHGQSRSRRRYRHGPMSLRQGHVRDRRSRTLGLA